MQGAAESEALAIVEELTYSHAVRIDSGTAAVQHWSELQSHRARLAELRSTLRQEAGREVRKNLRRDKRRELMSSFVKTPLPPLDRLLAGCFEHGEETLVMQIPDGPSADSRAWAAAAGAWSGGLPRW